MRRPLRFSILLLAACSRASPSPGQPTYAQDVAPILAAHCEGCHAADGIAPFALSRYNQAAAYADQIAYDTAALKMPPWGEAESNTCRPRLGFKNDLRLSPQEIGTLGRWAANGAPEGDVNHPATSPSINHLSSLARVDQELTQPTWTSTGTLDQYRCFVLDPMWTAPTYVRGTNFIPGNPQVVHHALVYLDTHRESLALVDPAVGSYSCFGDAVIKDASLLALWAPGALPIELGSDVGMAVTPGALIVVQVHYHPLAAKGAPLPDRSRLQLELDPTPPAFLSSIYLIGNFASPLPNGDGLLPGPDDPGGVPVFLIPAGATQHTESMRYTIPVDFPPVSKVWAVATHMHYVGVDMSFTVQHNSPETPATEAGSECLIDTPRYSFNWQRGYAYASPTDDFPEIRPGDQINMTCVYNNSLSNVLVQGALAQQGLTEPRDVHLGESSLDEMCLAVIGVTYPNSPNP